jgi:hypothetical protein
MRMGRKIIIGGLAAILTLGAFTMDGCRYIGSPYPNKQMESNENHSGNYKRSTRVLNPNGTVEYYRVKEFDRNGKLIKEYKDFCGKKHSTTPLISNPDGSFETYKPN